MLRSRRKHTPVVIVAAIALLGVATIGPSAAVAQVESPLVGAINAGTCDALGERVHDLEPVAVGDAMVGERVGSELALAMAYSITDLDAALDDFLAAPHAVVVPAAPDDPASVVACGEIGGYVDDDGLVVGLRPPGGTGLAGMAFLWNDDDAVEVELYLPQDLGASTGS
jgi:hypothetical protein